MNLSNRALALLLVLFLIFAIHSCKKNDDAGQSKATIVIGIPGDLETFNPLFGEASLSREIIHLTLLGLADLDEHSEFKPEIASSWESSPDFLELTYHLRKGALWSDGVPITAHDVKFTFDLLMDTTVASPNQGFTEYIKEVEVVDDHTVTFHFSEAYPAQIFDTAGEILPQHLLQDADRKSLRSHPFGRKPLASGPFKLGKWVAQQYIELVPNERYFGDKPKLERVIFKIIPDQSSMLMQLENGEIDMMSNVPVSQVAELQERNKQLNIFQISGRVYYYIGYNQNNDLFTNKNVRHALTMAIDRQKIIDALLYGFGTKCVGPLAPIVQWAFNQDVHELPFDPARARTLLRQEGWQDSDNDGVLDKNGRAFEFTLVLNAGNQTKSDIGVIVQQQLSRIGIRVKLKTFEWNTYLTTIQSHKFDACLGSLNSSYYIDPTPVFHSKATNMFNSISYANPEVDRLIETGRSEMVRQKAAEIWKEFQQILYDDQPFTFLFWKDEICAVNKKFKNVRPIALSSVYDLEHWYIDEN